MGKFGIGAVAAAAMSFFALVPSRDAMAQDFGQSWIDRITHELEQERGPLTAKPLDVNLTAGANFVYDNNIFLTPTGAKEKDSIIIPFVQVDLNYAEPRFDIEASFLGDYKRYLDNTSASDDEERVYLRARQTSSRWNFEISEIFQHVSDPAGLLFLNRISRIVSTTVPKIAFDIGRSWAIELAGNIQIVRYEDKTFSSQENNNFTVDFSVIYRTPWAFDVLAQFGYYNINYLADQAEANGTPDVFGYKYRVGFRGNLIERLSILCPNRRVDVADLPLKYRPAALLAQLNLDAVPDELPSIEEPEEVEESSSIDDRDVISLLAEQDSNETVVQLPAEGLDLRDHLFTIERGLIQQALSRSGGTVAHAARLLKLRRTTLVEKLRKFQMLNEAAATEV